MERQRVRRLVILYLLPAVILMAVSVESKPLAAVVQHDTLVGLLAPQQYSTTKRPSEEYSTTKRPSEGAVANQTLLTADHELRDASGAGVDNSQKENKMEHGQELPHEGWQQQQKMQLGVVVAYEGNHGMVHNGMAHHGVAHTEVAHHGVAHAEGKIRSGGVVFFCFVVTTIMCALCLTAMASSTEANSVDLAYTKPLLPAQKDNKARKYGDNKKYLVC